MMGKTKAGLLYPPKEESIVKLLVVVDMQNDFISGALGTKEAIDVVPHVVGKVVEAVNAGDAIVFTQDTHEANYMDTQEGKNLPVPPLHQGQRGLGHHPPAPGVRPGPDLFGKAHLRQHRPGPLCRPGRV